MNQSERDAAKSKMAKIREIYIEFPNNSPESILNEKYSSEANEKLDIALAHLKKYNRGSFLWYKDDVIGNNNAGIKGTHITVDREDRLIKRLKEKGIPNEEHLPIIYHLIEDGYCVGNWEPIDNKEKGQDPTQIKITFRGILFKGYENQASTIKWNKCWSRFSKTAAIFGFAILLYNTFDIRQLKEKEEKELLQKLYMKKIQSDSLKVFLVNKLDTSLVRFFKQSNTSGGTK